MIPTIPTPDEILDKGFSRGKKQADLLRTQKIPKHLKGKRIEERRIARRIDEFEENSDESTLSTCGWEFTKNTCFA